MSTARSFQRSRMRRSVSRPSRLGIFTSRRTTSGATLPIRSSAACPSPASATIARSGSPRSMNFSPCRSTSWSSTTISRTGRWLTRRLHGHAGRHRGALPRRPYLERPPERLGALPHQPQAQPLPLARRGAADPPVRDPQGEEPVLAPQVDLRPVCGGVLHHVAQRLLGDTEYRDPDRDRRLGHPVGLHLDPQPMLLPRPVGQAIQGRYQPDVLQRAGTQVLEQAAELHDRLLDQRLDPLQLLPLLLGRPRARAAQPEQDRVEVLPQAVVDLPHHPLALLLVGRDQLGGQPALLALRGLQAVVQPGVLERDPHLLGRGTRSARSWEVNPLGACRQVTSASRPVGPATSTASDAHPGAGRPDPIRAVTGHSSRQVLSRSEAIIRDGEPLSGCSISATARKSPALRIVRAGAAASRSGARLPPTAWDTSSRVLSSRDRCSASRRRRWTVDSRLPNDDTRNTSRARRPAPTLTHTATRICPSSASNRL